MGFAVDSLLFTVALCCIGDVFTFKPLLINAKTSREESSPHPTGRILSGFFCLITSIHTYIFVGWFFFYVFQLTFFLLWSSILFISRGFVFVCCLKGLKALLLFPRLVLHMEILLPVTRQLKLRGDKHSDFEDEQHLGVSGLQSTRVDGKLGSFSTKCKWKNEEWKGNEGLWSVRMNNRIKRFLSFWWEL